jgi:SAM-dependent methyltransferase
MTLDIKKRKYFCDFCDEQLPKKIYTPINTKRGMEVFLCNNCGLVQSFPTVEYVSRPPGSMSSDADRSSYKYTKDVISDRYEECFKSNVDFRKISKVLDVGSNRGAFIRYLSAKSNTISITAIEPDPSIINDYITQKNIDVQNCRFENAILKKNFYDFAYCAHTLEHAHSSKEMLKGIRASLRDNGLFFLAVPNLIFYNDIIEELFIDTHTYHFTFDVLRNFIISNGFEIIYAGSPKGPEVIFLLKKINVTVEEFEKQTIHNLNQKLVSFEQYKINIIKNRSKLNAASKYLKEKSKDKKIVIWGAGRIFDALIKFGKLDASVIDLVLDKYLYKYVSKIQGCNLNSPDVLIKENMNEIFLFVASRDYADEIVSEAKNMGVKNILVFGDDLQITNNLEN